MRAPDGSVALDLRGRAAGRGAYVCRDDACITTATSRGLLGRALKTDLPAWLPDELRAAAPTSTGGVIGQE